MTDKTQTPASDAATPATNQPTEPVETEDTAMTEPKAAVPDPKVAAVETRSQPKRRETEALGAPDTEAVATRASAAERDRVSTIYDLAGQVAAKSDETRTFPHVLVPLGGRDERITRRDVVANALLHRYSPTLFQLEDAARQYRGMIRTSAGTRSTSPTAARPSWCASSPGVPMRSPTSGMPGSGRKRPG